jgi:hypothetical protein
MSASLRASVRRLKPQHPNSLWETRDRLQRAFVLVPQRSRSNLHASGYPLDSACAPGAPWGRPSFCVVCPASERRARPTTKMIRPPHCTSAVQRVAESRDTHLLANGENEWHRPSASGWLPRNFSRVVIPA